MGHVPGAKFTHFVQSASGRSYKIKASMIREKNARLSGLLVQFTSTRKYFSQLFKLWAHFWMTFPSCSLVPSDESEIFKDILFTNWPTSRCLFLEIWFSLTFKVLFFNLAIYPQKQGACLRVSTRSLKKPNSALQVLQYLLLLGLSRLPIMLAPDQQKATWL